MIRPPRPEREIVAKKLLLFALLFLSFFPLLTAGVTDIAACQAISASGEYRLTQDIPGAGTCIVITANDVELDCQGYAIRYNSAGGATQVGIDATDGANPHTNLTIKDCIITKVSNLQTAGYGIRMTRFSDSRIINNTISTNGTTNNYGIFLTTNSRGNLIENNIIVTNGTSKGNAGIYAFSGSSNNVIRGNTVNSSGTTTSHGIWISTNSNNNTVQGNVVSAVGTTGTTTSAYGIYVYLGATDTKIMGNAVSTRGNGGNYGVYLQENVLRSNISNNTILTMGTTGNYGIHLAGTTAVLVNDNVISYNNISANGSTTNNFGIYLYRNTNNNTIIGNVVMTNGTTTNHGIYLLGVLNGPAENNTITRNNISTAGFAATSSNIGIYLSTNVNSNSLTENIISTSGTTLSYGIHLLGTTMQVANTIISRNSISTTGTGVSNFGIYVFNNASGTRIVENRISTYGTSTNYGVYVSGANVASNNGNISNNNISTGGTAASNFGIILYRNVNGNTLFNNSIMTNGTATDYGIYLVGTTALSVNDNVIDSNVISTFGATGGTNLGVGLATNANNNNITNNSITTQGATTLNYGVYMTGTATLATNNNRVEDNRIITNGTTTNYGVYLLTNANLNRIASNTIMTNGTTANYGVYLSGVTSNSDSNEVVMNNISAAGSGASNYGMYLYRNTSGNNISWNRIITAGTTTNHGIYAVGTTAMPVDNNTIGWNDINATGTAAAVTTYGISLLTPANGNNVTDNSIWINGTTANIGVYVSGSAALFANNNLIASNNVSVLGTTTNNRGVYLTANTNGNNVTDNAILVTGTSGNIGVYILGTTAITADNNTVSANGIDLVTSLNNNFGVYLATNTNGNSIVRNIISTMGTATNYGIQINGGSFIANSNQILNNTISARGSLNANYGIYLYRNTSGNNISQNVIWTNGTTSNHGIYLVGTTGLPVDNNTIGANAINATGDAATSTNYGLFLTLNANNNNLTRNNISTFGSTGSLGIYLLGAAGLGVNANRIESNSITTLGNSTNNYGIYLLTNANQNEVQNNTIMTSGTAGNIGVAVSGTTVASIQNTISLNTIRTSGTSANYGVFMTINALQNNATQNDIITNGTISNHGIYLLGAAGTSVDGSDVSLNTIKTQCSQATSDCHGIFLQNLVRNSRIHANSITTGSTSNNIGLYLFGTGALKVDNNYLEANVLNVTNADRIRLNTGTANTTIKDNSIIARDWVNYDLNVLAAEPNATQLIDQYLENYNFGGAGEMILVKNSSVGEIRFLSPITGNGSSLSKNIQIANNSISVNGSNPNLNKSARLSLYNLALSKPVILKDGAFCSDCTLVSYAGGNLSFNVSGFSSYSANENAQVLVWDDSDNTTIYTNNLTGFYVNYSNFTSGEPIAGSGISCNITFVDTGMQSMVYNSTSALYEYNRTFSSGGYKSYTVACEDTNGNFGSLNTTDYAHIEGVPGPTLPVNTTVIRSERGNLTGAAGSIDAQAGNISALEMNASIITGSWQGYAGRVGGTVYLTDSNGASLYNWSIFGSSGEVYATRALDVDFEDIACSNTSEIAGEEAYIGHDALDSESVRNTFSKNVHPAFTVGSVSVLADSCNATNLYVNSSSQNDTFFEVLLSDANANLVYTAILDANKAGYDSASYDFQMLVGENGNNPALTPYYFFIEID
ncbi:MAG: right-handed parallel beta-helix repeat-containing protein [Nanoarchaeota archaeon]